MSNAGKDEGLESYKKSMLFGLDSKASETDVKLADDELDVSPLFEPIQVGSATLPNRIVMAPMTRNMSPGGVPDDKVAAYYRRRAAGGTGLILTEGTYVPDPAAGFSPNVPRFHGEEALEGWRQVVEGVHAEGGCIFPQLWHVGLMPLPTDDFDPQDAISPSGFLRGDEKIGREARGEEIERAIEAFGTAARSAMDLGCDGIQIHGAHGYLIDQFFWEVTNRRNDAFGGNSLVERSRVAVAIVEACRAATAPDFPISFRLSQWKQQDFGARLAPTPQDLESFLLPLADAGVDIFDCSTRRFWEPEFEDSDMNLAGWAKKLTGKVTSTVGSITLSTDLFSGYVDGAKTAIGNLGRLVDMFGRGDFDLVSVGRASIADPEWAHKVREGKFLKINGFDTRFLQQTELY